MLRLFSLERQRREAGSVRPRSSRRPHVLLVGTGFLGACSLLAPLDDVQVDSSTGGSVADGGAQGQGQSAAAGMTAVAGADGNGGMPSLGTGGGAGAGAEAGVDAGAGPGAGAGGGTSAGAGGAEQAGAAGEPSVKEPNGTACSDEADCASGFCVEDVCCDASCGAACSSCRAASTGMADGVCGFVQSGTDPDDDCDESSAVCGRDGHCDGAGACRFKGVDEPCGDESCSAGMYSPAAYCDGAGACAQPASISCGNYPCQGTLCAVTCNPSVQCPDGLWCDSGSCRAKKPNGGGCNDDVECISSDCVEGVCCDDACPGTCRSCRAANTGMAEGHCAPVSAGTDPDGECTAAPVSSCGNDGYCDGASGCRQYADGTVCHPGSCSDGANSSTEYAEVACSGGTCADAATSGCGDYKCGGDACRESCSQNSHCARGNYCESNECVPTKELGSLCEEPAQCETGICGAYETDVRPGHCCSTPTNCDCPGPAFVNLLQNPGFDEDLAHWDVIASDVMGGSYGWYEFEERDMCLHSGQFERRANPDSSGYQVRLRQCVPVEEGTTYNFGGSWKSSRFPEYAAGQSWPDGEAWNANCVLAFYATMELCEDYDNEWNNRFDGYKFVNCTDQTTAIYQWFDFEETMTAPQAAQAAGLECMGTDDYAPGTYLYFDKFYISPAPAQY